MTDGPDDSARLLLAVLRDTEDPSTLVISCQRALRVISEEEHPRLWTVLQALFAHELTRTPHGDHALNQLRARSALDAAARRAEHCPPEAEQSLRALEQSMDGLGDGPSADAPPADLIDAYQNALSEIRGGPHTAEREYRLAYGQTGSLHRADAGDRDVAITHLLAALRGFDPEEQPVRWAETQYLLGRCHENHPRRIPRVNHERAIACYKAALDRCGPSSGWKEWPDAMHALGVLYPRRLSVDRMDNEERSLECFHALADALSPETDPKRWSAAQHGLGVCYSTRRNGDPAENIELALQHLTESLRYLNPLRNPEEWWTTHHAVAAAYDYRLAGDPGGNLDRAVHHLRAALQACNRRRTPNGWAMLHQSLGMLYAKRASVGSSEGDHREDLTLARESLDKVMAVRTRSGDPQGWALAMETMAMLDEADPPPSNEQPAEPLSEDPRPPAAPRPAEAGGQSLREVLEAALTALREEGKTRSVGPESVEHIEHRIVLLRAAAEVHDPEDHPVAWARNCLLLQAALEQHTEVTGERHWRERADLLAAALTVHTVDSDPVLCARAAEKLGESRAAQGLWAGAAEAFLLSREAGEQLYSSAATLLGRRNQLLNHTAKVPRLASYCLARAGRLTEAVGALESGRARILGDALDHDNQRLERLAHDHPQLHRRYRDAAERLHRVHHTGDISSDAGERLIGQANQTRAARRMLDGVVRRIRNIDGYADFQRPPGPETVREAVDPAAPIVYLNTTPWGSLILLVTADDAMRVRPLWVDELTGDNLDDLFNRSASPDTLYPMMAGYTRMLYNLIETRFSNGSTALTFGSGWEEPDAVVRTGREELGRLRVVGRTLLSPLAAALANLRVSRAVLIPCGSLATMPLHTLPYADSGRCLIDDLAVTFAPSARVVRHARDRAARDWGTPALAGIGNPLTGSVPLPFAAREVQEIAALFELSTCAYGEQATVERLTSAARSATHVHLACHGMVPFTSRETPYLHLAGGRQLTLEELVRDRPFPAARLVVLSACQSALVGSHQTTDESLGLATAVMLSGTPGVIGALWPVNDLSTALLMTRFYLYHLRGDPAEHTGPMPPWQALGNAQRWLSDITAEELAGLLRDDPALMNVAKANETRTPGARSAVAAVHNPDPGSRPFADAYYWAPFIYIGE